MRTNEIAEEAKGPEPEKGTRGGKVASKASWTPEVNARRSATMKGYRNNLKHGFYQARKALHEFGMRTIDGRSKVGVALREFRQSIAADLGGDLSAQQNAVLDVLVREKLMLDSVDAWILAQPTIILKRSKSLMPVIQQRQALASAFVNNLQTLGLSKQPAPTPSLADYVATKAVARKSPTRTAESSTKDLRTRPRPIELGLSSDGFPASDPVPSGQVPAAEHTSTDVTLPGFLFSDDQASQEWILDFADRQSDAEMSSESPLELSGTSRDCEEPGVFRCIQCGQIVEGAKPERCAWCRGSKFRTETG